MHKTTLNLAALIAAALLSACGGGSDDAITPADNGNRNAGNVSPTSNNGGNADTRSGRILVPAPTQPTAAETAAFNKRKVGREEANIITSVFRLYSINANGHTLMRAISSGRIGVTQNDFSSLPSGFASISGTATEDGTTNVPVSIRSYQGFRSGVAMFYNTTNNNTVLFASPYGVYTPTAAIPAAGKATYTGIAFDHSERGSLTYNVDFGAKRGSGRIDGLSRYGDITLERAAFDRTKAMDGSAYTYIQGDASTSRGGEMDYILGFFGNRAEEIAGQATSSKQEAIGFHGTRGAITE